MNGFRGWPVIVVVGAVFGCVDKPSSSTDSATAAAKADSAAAADANMIQVDTASTPAPPAGVNSPSTPRPSVTGEVRRDENATPRPTRSEDPMPPLAGETNPRSGTMKPAEPILRDSASGPKFRIDSKGNVTPIKN